MKALLFKGPGILKVEEVPVPALGEGDLLVKVRIASICGTDLRIYKNGHFKIPSGTTRVLGHEVVGEIVEAGKNQTKFSKGMRVAVVPNIGCGTCPMCTRGLYQLCPDYEAFGISIDGGFEEYMLIPRFAVDSGNVLPIPEGVAFRDAALAEPLSCCYNSYEKLGTVPGDTVVVIGAGPIGALHIAINRLAGASKIISADIVQERLDKMKEYGADVLINTGEKNLYDAVMAETNGEGADVVITAASVPSLQAEALRIAGMQGRINFFGGLPAGKENVTLNTNLIHYKELNVVGTTGSSILDYSMALKIIASKRIGSIGDLITGAYPIDNALEAFDYAMSGKGMKTAIFFD